MRLHTRGISVADDLVARTAHAAMVQKQAGLCRYYLCIIFLLGVLVLLLFIGNT
jgi:hypothetical protein